MLHFRTITP